MDRPASVNAADRLLALPAPAKLNLFLHVTGRRTDGYHLLQTAFRLIDLHDEIDLVRRADGAIVRTAGPQGVPPEDDLAIRAARALQAATDARAGVDIAVRKRIPAGAGLGGGSSDAATVLIGLNRLWALGLDRARLADIGLQLGADVPFFLFGRNAIGEGVGERLEAIALPSQAYLVVWPGVSVPTATIFADPGLTRNTPAAKISGFSDVARVSCAQFGRNDLEPVARARYPEVARALAWLAQCGEAGSAQPRMSGSGSGCFVAWPGHAPAPLPPAGMRVWRVSGLAEHPLRSWLG